MTFAATAGDAQSTTYRDGPYAIVHQVLGFGIESARLFEVLSDNREILRREFAGKRCLTDAMDYCRRLSDPIPETDFATYAEQQR